MNKGQNCCSCNYGAGSPTLQNCVTFVCGAAMLTKKYLYMHSNQESSAVESFLTLTIMCSSPAQLTLGSSNCSICLASEPPTTHQVKWYQLSTWDTVLYRHYTLSWNVNLQVYLHTSKEKFLNQRSLELCTLCEQIATTHTPYCGNNAVIITDKGRVRFARLKGW